MKNKKYIIFGVIILVAVISGVMKDSFKSSGNNRPTSQITQSTNMNNQSQQRETRTPTASTNNQTNRSSDLNGGNTSLSTYISLKDQYDQEISRLATDINAYLGSHADFRNDQSLWPRAERIEKQVHRTLQELRGSSMNNSAVQAKLIEVFEAELGRVAGLVEGIKTSKIGGDYTPGFKHGGDAFDRFEEANEALNKMLR